MKSGWGDSTRREGEFRRARGRKSGGRKTRLKGTGSREGSRAVRTWEERGENSGVRRELRKGERRIAGLRPDFDRMLPKFGWGRGGKEWLEGVRRKEIERREQGGWVWLCSAAGVDEDGRNGSARTDGRGMVAGNSGRSEICRGDEIRGEERLSDGGRWVKLLVVGFRPGRLVREGDRWS